MLQKFLLNLTTTRFLNIRLDTIKVSDEARHPHMVHTTLASTRGTNYHDRWLSRTVLFEVLSYVMSNFLQSMSTPSYLRTLREEVFMFLRHYKHGESILFFLQRHSVKSKDNESNSPHRSGKLYRGYITLYRIKGSLSVCPRFRVSILQKPGLIFEANVGLVQLF